MSRLKLIREELKDFCSTVTIQGMSNISNSQKGIFLRMVWFVVVAASFIISGMCIKNSVVGM
jgi:hypothetical protein